MGSMISIEKKRFIIVNYSWQSLGRVLCGEIRPCERDLRIVLECARVETLPERILLATLRIEVPKVIQAVEG